MNMSTTLLPLALQRLSLFALFAIGIFLVAAYTALATLAAERAPLAPRTRARLPFVVGGSFARWLAAGVLVGQSLQLASPADARLLSLLVGFGPMLAVIAMAFGTKTLGALDEAVPSAWLIRLQTYRVAGLMFLYPFLYYGVVPAGFAIPA